MQDQTVFESIGDGGGLVILILGTVYLVYLAKFVRNSLTAHKDAPGTGPPLRRFGAISFLIVCIEFPIFMALPVFMHEQGTTMSAWAFNVFVVLLGIPALGLASVPLQWLVRRLLGRRAASPDGA